MTENIVKVLENIQDIDNLEAILVPDEKIMEAAMDPRKQGDSGDSRYYVKDYVDWQVWSGSGFGNTLASYLRMGKGFSAEVTDMGDSLAVRASYHNPTTGRGVEKTFIILFADPRKGDGRLMITSTKWRTFSNVSQVASYITSSINSYIGQTNTV